MAVQDSALVDAETARRELTRVLQARSFAHAPTLAQLLKYLCEKRLGGEAAQIKEYSIGVEVFRRGASFDQESDSIVRVEVNRLRKRLAEYYAGEGAADPLRISIPVGQYVPEFEPAELPGENREKEATPAANSEPPLTSRRSRLRLVLLAVIAVGVLAAGTVLLVVGRMQKKRPASAPNPPPAASEESLVGPPRGDEIRILAGSPRSYVDHAGKLWSADRDFTGGTSTLNTSRHFARTQDPAFYRASRDGQFRYEIPLRPGVYELHLYFAESLYGAENSGVGGEGSRLMTVRANGRTILEQFDVFADAGGGRIADVRVFPDLRPEVDGRLHLEFVGERGTNATLSAIEILPGVPGRIRPVRLLARQTPYYSNESRWWSPDNYFEGGQLATYADPVGGTDDPDLYETERWGNFSYAIPVGPGKYTAFLHFAVRRRGWNELQAPQGKEEEGPVSHIFNVFCNGRAILENFDPAREAHGSDVVVRKAVNLTPNAQGKLLFEFVPVKGYASVTGMEILPQ